MTVLINISIVSLQVTIVDRDEREEQNLITRRNTALRDHQILHGLNGNILQYNNIFLGCCGCVVFWLGSTCCCRVNDQHWSMKHVLIVVNQ